MPEGIFWHSPREIAHLSGSENICQAEIRRIGPELDVLYNVFREDFSTYSQISHGMLIEITTLILMKFEHF